MRGGGGGGGVFSLHLGYCCTQVLGRTRYYGIFLIYVACFQAGFPLMIDFLACV